MFAIINNFEDFSNDLEEGKFVLVTSENIMYVVKDGSLVDSEEVYGNFEEVSYSIINEGFFSEEEAFIFEDAPYYQEGLYGEIYCVNFTASKIKSLSQNPGELSIVNLSNEPLMFSNFQESDIINFKVFTDFEKHPDQILDPDSSNFISLGYNVKIENALIEGPIRISILRLGNIDAK
jgi:hypothetical protein